MGDSRQRLDSVGELDKIFSDKGYCPSMEELVTKSTTATDASINTAAGSTKANLAYLLKLAVSEVKKHRTITEQLNVIRDELTALKETTADSQNSHAQVRLTLDVFRAEMMDTVQRQIQKAIQIPSTQPFSFATISNKRKDQEVIQAMKGVRIAQQAQEILAKEDSERKKRQLNLCIRGMDVPFGDSVDAVMKMLEDININTNVESVKMVEPRERNSRPPRLIIALKDQKNRLSVLRSVRKLKSAGDTYRDVFIGPGYTPIQDKEQYELREERRRRNAMETDENKMWIVHRGALKQRCNLTMRQESS
ncbi:uncharacterized protein LOC134854633 [Symsagittifera roscoffensis]|uniref:uncharacterized protein LOC134854633 n=1 Tax=Symsagittifera roscoffensis TaxID=84072 RepID=UPI00307CAEA6